MDDTRRLYTDLACLWPLWGDAATEYAHDCRHVAGLIRRYARRPASTLLDIGCGGGKSFHERPEELHHLAVRAAVHQQERVGQERIRVREGSERP